MKEATERAPYLDLSPGLNGINYPANYKFAPNANAPGPCNYKAELVPTDAIIKSLMKR